MARLTRQTRPLVILLVLLAGSHGENPIGSLKNQIRPHKWLQRFRKARFDKDKKNYASTPENLGDLGTDELEDYYSEDADSFGLPKGLRNAALTTIAGLQRMQWSRIFLRGCQVGILAYLLTSIYVATKEILEEIDPNQQQSSYFARRDIIPILEEVASSGSLSRRRIPEASGPWSSLVYRLASTMNIPVFDTEEGKPSLERILLSLTRAEVNMLEQCLYRGVAGSSNPREVWSRIVGFADVQQAVIDRMMPLLHNQNPYASFLAGSDSATSAADGILLYGPPGCGKSMLLQAICESIRKPCLVVTPSVLLRKYVGETNQRIRTLFSLASKLGGDCVLCLDELDGIFRERRHDEHDVSREAKTEFLQLWDGISSGGTKLLVVGATNRPFDVDAAVLRRMPQSHFIGLPDTTARRMLLEKFVAALPTEELLSSSHSGLDELVRLTEGYSPSDIQQLVRTAVLQGPVRESYTTKRYRPLSTQDLFRAQKQIGPTRLSYAYTTALVEFDQERHPEQRDQRQQPSPPQSEEISGHFHDAGTFNVDRWHYMEEDESESGHEDDEDF